ncbi:MAG: coproporphyrinogen III oxidase [Alphaproteobacteria bacterium]|nr:coproporphyrinogen III oxidase [Alphaproteobacteria bacterium]
MEIPAVEWTLDEKKATAAAWFRSLRDQICGAFEAIETDLTGSDAPAGTFTRTAWTREGGGSGEMSLMKGRVFEKVGVNISTVEGEFSEQFRKEIPGATENPRFWASGISLVAHMASPLVPAAHFNTRMICVGDAPARLWFGGGGDLNPMFEVAEDTADFHAAFKAACDEADSVSRASTAMSPRSGAKQSPEGDRAEQALFYPAFKDWCDEYFFIPHRNVARGVGGIFYDYFGLNTLGGERAPITSGQFGKGGVGKEATARGMEVAANAGLDWQQSFAFTQAVGRAFAHIYPAIIRRHMFEPWTQEQRHHQLVKRGRYAEYNLLYDRGTRFGLMTGGNAEAILMSLPPVAIWE